MDNILLTTIECTIMDIARLVYLGESEVALDLAVTLPDMCSNPKGEPRNDHGASYKAWCAEWLGFEGRRDGALWYRPDVLYNFRNCIKHQRAFTFMHVACGKVTMSFNLCKGLASSSCCENGSRACDVNLYEILWTLCQCALCCVAQCGGEFECARITIQATTEYLHSHTLFQTPQEAVDYLREVYDASC